MHEFAEEYVANLAPRKERYDTRLGDDFYVGTFPNGVKTWIYVYDVNGYTRRQTLGVFPEMPLERALEALYAARRTRAVETELAEQGLDGGKVRQAEDSPIDIANQRPRRSVSFAWLDRRFAFGAIAGALLSAAATVGVLRVTSGAGSAPALAVVAEPAASPQVAAEPAAVPAPEHSPAPATRSEAQAEETARVVAQAADETDAAPEAVAADHELSSAQRAVIDLQRDLSGTLAWAQLTSGIDDGEPVDDLGWIVELGEQPREIFYFVRVRGMDGDELVYRWSHEDELVQEDTVTVTGGWHAPAFAGVTVTPARMGKWRVEVLAPDRRKIGFEQFEIRRADGNLLSRR